jgi:Heparinase II/III-like protein/Heparinase II/III N-terminus
MGGERKELPLVLLSPEPPLGPSDRALCQDQCFPVRGVKVHLMPPIDWAMDPPDNRAWRFWFHTMQFLHVPLRVYAADRDIEALEVARGLVLDWIEGNAPGSARAGDFAWFDMSAGIRASFFGYTWRECRRCELLNEAQESILEASLKEHGVWLAHAENYTSHSNHGLYQDAGLLLLAIYGRDLKESNAWRSLAEKRFVATLKRHVQADEGMHKEQSPGYHMYIADLVTRLHSETGIGGTWLGELLSRIDSAAGWLVMPDGLQLPFGDTNMSKAPDFAMCNADQEGLAAFLESGYAMIRRQDSFLAMTCCYHTETHKHADELSWCLHENDRLIVGEAGCYGYRDEADPMRVYARSSQGHNTLMLDGQSFDWRGRAPYGSGLLASGEGYGWYAIMGRNPLLSDVEHKRLLLYRPGSVVLIIDSLQASKEHDVLRRLHFGPELRATKTKGGAKAHADGREIATLVDWSERDVEVDLVNGMQEPRLDGWMSPTHQTKVPVYAVTLRSRIDSGLLVHGVHCPSSDLSVIRADVDANLYTLILRSSGTRQRLMVNLAGTKLEFTVSLVPEHVKA